MGRLEERVVEFDVACVKGYVRQVSEYSYRWTLKSWHTLPPEILGSGVQPTPKEAFKRLYQEGTDYGFVVKNKGD
jgi:hypothetical protein